MIKEATLVFSPNQVLSKSMVKILVVSQIIVLGAIWFLHPFVFFPTPIEVWRSFGHMWSLGLGAELMTSFQLSLEAIGVATIISLVLAYLTVVPFFRPIVTFISKLRFLSLVGLTFFFTLMTSGGHQLKLYILVFSISVFFVTSMADVVASVPKDKFDLARTLQMGEFRTVWEVVIRGQLDKAFEVLRQNAAIGWMMLTMVEGISRSEGGVGAMLLNQSKHFHLSAVIAIQITILLLGLLQDYAIGCIRNIFCPYANLTLERK
jgi:NitT/TauT family transport system permease protein